MTTEPVTTVWHGPPSSGPGPLTKLVLAYDAEMRAIIGGGPPDWTPLKAYVATDDFERIGTFLEVHDWNGYTSMLTGWASATERFETSIHRITEGPATVFYEIEERHYRGDHAHIVNSMTAFEFNDDAKICALRVYLQQADVPPPQT